jgi:hypothetical protein
MSDEFAPFIVCASLVVAGRGRQFPSPSGTPGTATFIGTFSGFAAASLIWRAPSNDPPDGTGIAEALDGPSKRRRWHA